MLSLEANDRLRALAGARGPLLVATDLDGTLAPIVPHASEARVPPTTLAVLDRLSTQARVAVITGRDLNTARRMVSGESVIVIGSHGLESSFAKDLLPGLDRVTLAAALEAIEQKVISAVPSAFLHIERKAISTAFHYRTSPELEPALRKVLATLPSGLRLREGRMVLEVLPNAEGGKDVALLALCEHFKPHSMLCLGDDQTDVFMFRAAKEAAKRNDIELLLCGIASGAETPPEIIELSDILLRSTDEALEALETVARGMGV
jgi:trehalose 6-phosphate phosphatase